MLKVYTFWLKSAIVLQLLTAGIHALSFLAEQTPENETEKQLLDLMRNYKLNMGAGYSPSTMEMFLALSSCFSLLYLLGGLINLQLVRIRLNQESFKGILNINILVFGVAFVIMYFFTFLPPIILTGLTFLLLVIARITINKSQEA